MLKEFQEKVRMKRYSMTDLTIIRIAIYSLHILKHQSNETNFISVLGTGANKRIRHDGELRLNFKLTNKLSLTSYLYDNYDSAPVVPTAGNLDYGWSTGLKYGF